MLKSYVAFDIETTGLSPEHNEIIEIGALKVREGKVVDRFIRFIEPEAGIPPMITQLTGITNDMVEGAGNCGEVLPEFLEFCEQDTLIGHNVQFDFSIRKNNTIIRRITENVDQLTAGEKVMSIKVSADYTFNNRLNLRLFYDRKVDTPYLSLSYPTTNTNFGLSIRYTLMQ